MRRTKDIEETKPAVRAAGDALPPGVREILPRATPAGSQLVAYGGQKATHHRLREQTKCEKPRPAGTPSAYVFRAVFRSPLGLDHLEPESGRTVDGEIKIAMDGLCAQRDDAFVIEIRRAPRKEGG